MKSGVFGAKIYATRDFATKYFPEWGNLVSK